MKGRKAGIQCDHASQTWSVPSGSADHHIASEGVTQEHGRGGRLEQAAGFCGAHRFFGEEIEVVGFAPVGAAHPRPGKNGNPPVLRQQRRDMAPPPGVSPCAMSQEQSRIPASPPAEDLDLGAAHLHLEPFGVDRSRFQKPVRSRGRDFSPRFQGAKRLGECRDGSAAVVRLRHRALRRPRSAVQ